MFITMFLFTNKIKTQNPVWKISIYPVKNGFLFNYEEKKGLFNFIATKNHETLKNIDSLYSNFIKILKLIIASHLDSSESKENIKYTYKKQIELSF